MHRCLLTALVSVLPVVGVTQTPPIEVDVDPDGTVVVSNLPDIFGRDEIARHLRSGLTTTLAFQAQIRGTRQQGGARIDVRFELWDEIFQVAAVGIDGKGERTQLDDLEALATWWSELRLTVIVPDSGSAPKAGTLLLDLSVIPFSQSEQDDAQRWFSRSFAGSTTDAADRVTDSAERRGDPLEQVLGVLMATSIQRGEVMSYHWAMPLPGDG
jgi:hypothetical protein